MLMALFDPTKGIYYFIDKFAEEVVDILKVRSSGTLSYTELAARGHPYKADKPRPFYMFHRNPGYVNVHSQTFKNSWTWEPTSLGWEIFNTAPYAQDLFEGIPGLTVARPMVKTLADEGYFKTKEKELMNNITNTLCLMFKSLGE